MFLSYFYYIFRTTSVKEVPQAAKREVSFWFIIQVLQIMEHIIAKQKIKLQGSQL